MWPASAARLDAGGAEDHYDDGGFSGSSLERPALKRLLADIQASKIDCVVVHKVDRRTRALMDFSKLVDLSEKHR